MAQQIPSFRGKTRGTSIAMDDAMSFARPLAVLAVPFALALVAGCSVETTPTTPTTHVIPDGMTAACKGGALLFANGFKPAKLTEFVGQRSEATEPRLVAAPKPADPPANPPTTTGGGTEAAWTATLGADRKGEPCAGATDRAACDKAFASYRVLADACDGLTVVPKAAPAVGADVAAPAPRTPGYCATSYYAYTQGAEIGHLDTLDKARAFFGGIDSPEEAIFLVQLSGEGLSCTGSAPAAFKLSGDGYDVQTGAVDRYGCTVTRKIVHVTGAGQISVVSDEQLPACR